MSVVHGYKVRKPACVWIFEELPRIKVTATTFAQHTPAAYVEKLRPRQQAKKTAL